MKLYICFFGIFFWFCKVGYAHQNSQEKKDKIESFFKEMVLVMNSQSKDGIKHFFNFYSDKDAIFIYHSILINNNSKKNPSQELKMNVNEYIKYLTYISTTPISYHYDLNVSSWKYIKKSDSYIYSIHINEVYITSIKDKKNQYFKIKAKVSTNCNYSFNSNPLPQISGVNCFEKIAIE